MQAQAGLEALVQLRRGLDRVAEADDLLTGRGALEIKDDEGLELGVGHARNSSPIRSRKASRARLMRLFTVPMESPSSSAISS